MGVCVAIAAGIKMAKRQTAIALVFQYVACFLFLHPNHNGAAVNFRWWTPLRAPLSRPLL